MFSGSIVQLQLIAKLIVPGNGLPSYQNFQDGGSTAEKRQKKRKCDTGEMLLTGFLLFLQRMAN